MAAPLTGTSTAVIHDGTRTQIVHAGSLLTPAQAVAVQQVLSQGIQSLILNSQGGAAGGSLALPSSQALSTFVIPRNVSAITDFASGAVLSITGSLVNGGNLFAITSNAAVTDAILRAASINNLLGATISSNTPGLNLTLSARTGALTNAGSILSGNNINLISGNGVINNTGVVQSSTGNTRFGDK